MTATYFSVVLIRPMYPIKQICGSTRTVFWSQLGIQTNKMVAMRYLVVSVVKQTNKMAATRYAVLLVTKQTKWSL